jgi:hypothetical protein
LMEFQPNGNLKKALKSQYTADGTLLNATWKTKFFLDL